jgi:exodeoxyribonuclease VII large subunit
VSRDSPLRSAPAGRGADQRPDEEAPFSVSELLGLVSETLEQQFSRVLVVGEITSFKRAASGHCYFTLSDNDAAVDALIFRQSASRLAFRPEVGDEVVCRGNMAVYAKQGRMQLYVQAMKPVGEGAAQRALEALKRKLEAEGLFSDDRKRRLPFLPKTIGVVTSRSGAALHDILTTLRRRYRGVRVILSAATVQGAEAPSAIVEALGALAELAQKGECDVAIVGRGGGAAEDLAAFNDERVVRAVAAFPCPIVSAVGHEVDFTLCDFAADHRAATPTAAAEAVVPVRSELVEQLGALDLRLTTATARYLDTLRHRVGDIAGRLRDPARLVAGGRQRVDELAIRMERVLTSRSVRERERLASARAGLDRAGRTRRETLDERLTELRSALERGLRESQSRSRSRFATAAAKLDALSPLSVLGRGYSVVTRDDARIVRSSDEISAGDELSLRFHEGRAVARVISSDHEE